MAKSKEQNYYEILDIAVDATQDDIKKAYRLAKKTLSDTSLATYSLFDEDETRNMLVLIDEASSVLSSPELKRKYDKDIMGIKEPEDVSPGSIRKNIVSDYESISNTKDKLSKNKKSNTKNEVGNEIAFQATSIKSTGSDPEFETKIAKAIEFDGEFLRKVREYRGISINDISIITKINPEYLLAIEKFDLESLPPKVYLLGFLRHYCKAVDLDAIKVTSSYIRLIDEARRG